MERRGVCGGVVWVAAVITVTLTKDEITPHIRKAMRTIEGAPQVLGRTAANLLRQHFRALNASRPNKLGGKRTNFYSAVAASVQNPQVAAGTITIAISHPHIAQRYFGGTIHPTKKKLLAIPTDPRSYGKSPRVYSGALAYIPSKKGGAVLVEGEQRTTTRGKNKGRKRTVPKQGGKVIYALKKSITQRPDTSVFPSDSEMLSALDQAARDMLEQGS